MHPVVRAAFASIVVSLSMFIVITPVKAGSTEIDFSLTDHAGKTFHLHDLRGKVVLVFFGYTFCPDVCPIELQHMATALKHLGEDALNARGLFVTVDPERDSPRVLGQYLNYFDAGLVGLTGTRRQIDAVASQFRVIYQKNPHTNSQYTMDHTANLFVIDQTGKLDTIVPFGFPAAHIEKLLRDLMAEGK
jgi:cytochrome oxidase Cu insertion factor (SCO1/SenC/PrrC family)